MESIREHVADEILIADSFARKGKFDNAFLHLERAHVLGQAITVDHARVHWRMLKIGWKRGNVREVLGQVIRIIGAVTKTTFGIYPKGNTGGANVYFFKPMPIPEDLQAILDKTKGN